MPKSPTPSLTVTQHEPGILLLTIDMPNSSANILTQSLLDELDELMQQLGLRTDIEGLILFSGKPNIFIVGADLHFIARTHDWPDEQIIRFCDRGRAVLARFSRCPFVTIAAIHGACVGGGLELPLWCDGRLASESRRTQLGLPEVKLGLIPGWAGTARLPRLAGFENGAQLVTSGQLVSASTAKQMGFVDQVVPQSELLAAATRQIRQLNETQSFIEDRRTIMGPVADLTEVEKTIQRVAVQIVENKDLFPYAPTVALEHMARTASLVQTEAWKSESQAMAQVYGSPANRGLLNHFFLVDRNKKFPGLVDLELQPNPITTIGIVGAGLMGRSIAQNCLQRGISVLILDANKNLADQVAQELSNDLVEQSQPGSPEKRCSISAIEDYSSFTAADLVLESVVETFDVKKIVLQKIESAVSDNTLLASNTSAIPIEKLAGVLTRPKRFCGIHFCHPELMSLVEVVCGPASSEQTVADGVGFVRSIGKMAVAMNDGAGFVVNRLLGAMLDQSFRLLTAGVPIQRIDEAMREFGFLGGPFEIIDVIGADTCLYAGRTMWESGLRCVTLSPLLPRMVKLGRLGRKSGIGFYRYPDPRGDKQFDPELSGIIGSYVTGASFDPGTDAAGEPHDISTTIANQILAAMVLEATHILDEEMVADFRDIELCVIHGFSFPKHQGGILYWADQMGIKTINQILFQIAEHEPRMEPGERLKRMRLKNQKFYAD